MATPPELARRHARIRGLNADPIEIIVALEVEAGLIGRIWPLSPES